MARHIYADLMIAYANDTTLKKIQYRYDSAEGNWVDVLCPPTWDVGRQYRIKPKPMVKKYLYAVGKDAADMVFVTTCYYKDDREFDAFWAAARLNVIWRERIDASVIEVPDE